MTFKSKAVVTKMINTLEDGENTERINSIWQYETQDGVKQWAVFLITENHDMFTSPFVFNPKLLWSKEEGKLQDPE